MGVHSSSGDAGGEGVVGAGDVVVEGVAEHVADLDEAQMVHS